MYKWMRKAGLVAVSAAMVVALFAATAVTGTVNVATVEASSANVELTSGNAFAEQEDAHRGKRHKKGKRSRFQRGSSSDDGGFGFSGRRWRGD